MTMPNANAVLAAADARPAPLSQQRSFARRVLARPLAVVSAAILIGAEVFGAAFAGGWAVASLMDWGTLGEHIMQGILFVGGTAAMVAFIRNAQRVEPFTRRG